MTDEEMLRVLKGFAENQKDLGFLWKAEVLKEIADRVEKLIKEKNAQI
jgi:hypothetical protein